MIHCHIYSNIYNRIYKGPLNATYKIIVYERKYVNFNAFKVCTRKHKYFSSVLVRKLHQVISKQNNKNFEQMLAWTGNTL